MTETMWGNNPQIQINHLLKHNSFTTLTAQLH